MKQTQPPFGASLFRLFALVAVAGCMQTASAGELKISCGVAVNKTILSKVKAKFEQETGHHIIVVSDMERDGTFQYYQHLESGKSEVGITSGGMPDIKKTLMEAGVSEAAASKLAFRTIFNDIMKIFASPKAGVSTLSEDQVIKVFSGEITNWKLVGGADFPIRVVYLPAYGSTNNFFKRVMVKMKEFPSDSIKVDSVSELITNVARSTGHVAFATSTVDIQTAVEIKTPHPIGRPITAFTIGKPSQLTEQFFKYVQAIK